MAKITKQNVGGTDYTMVGCALTGVCPTSASDYVKAVTLSDGDIVSDGMTVACTFANGNTAGIAPGTQTIYSSDQVNYYSDDQLTVPFTLAPSGCYVIEYTGTGNAYTYTSYPVIQVGQISGPLCSANGKEYGGTAWAAGDTVLFLYTGGKFLMLNVAVNVVQSGNTMPVSSSAVYNNNIYSSIGRYLSTQGWYKIFSGSIRSAGVILNIMLGTVYNYAQNSSHDIHFAYGYKNANMVETVRDIHGVFDKIRFYYRDDNIKNCEIYVSFTKNTAEYVYAKINSTVAKNISNTANAVTYNFVATDVSQLDNNYVEYSLGTDGFYINGENRTPSAPSTDGLYNLQCTVASGVPSYSWSGIVDGAAVRNLGGISTYTFTLPKVQKYRVLRGAFVGAETRMMAFEIFYGQGYVPNYRMSVPDVSSISDKLTMTYDRDACTITFSSSSDVFYSCFYSIQEIEAYLGLPVTV